MAAMKSSLSANLQAVRPSVAAFTPIVAPRSACKRQSTQARAESSTSASMLGRREVLQSASVAALLLAPQSAMAKAVGGFNQVSDNLDGYEFQYPFGWQEISVSGTDVVYKDIVEPLESVSVTLTPTDKTDISDFGDVAEVTETLARNVLTPSTQEVTIVNSVKRTDAAGRNYYEVEFTAKAQRYTRHSLAVVAVQKGKLYTLTTGANERRWLKMKDRLETVIHSFVFA